MLARFGGLPKKKGYMQKPEAYPTKQFTILSIDVSQLHEFVDARKFRNSKLLEV